MNLVSNLVIPFLVLGIIGYGVYKKINVYSAFIEGCKESFEMIITIFPNLLAMILAIKIFLNSNVLNVLEILLEPILFVLNIPFMIIPMILMRPISGNASLVLLNEILGKYGADTFIGILASVIQGSTDTTFYILTLYFGYIGIKKIRYGLLVGLIADFIGIIVSIVLVKLMFL